MTEARPWLRFYEAHVPPRLEYPQTPLPEALWATARRCPDAVAMIFKGRRITYREHDATVDRFAAALQALGVQKGDRVAIHLPNCPQFITTFYAALRIGAIVVPCNPIYTARELRHQLRDSGATIIVTLSSTYPILRQIRGETALRHIVVARIKDYFPPLLHLIFTLLLEKKRGHRLSLKGESGASWFMDLMGRASPKPRPVPISLDDTAVLMYTGGTTGLSKGADLTHRNILVNAHQVLVWVNAAEAQDATLTALPLFHSYGMTCCMNPGALRAGTAVLVPDPRDVTDILKTIQTCRPTFYPGVPAMYAAIINHPQVSRYNLRSLKVCNSGAAPLPVEVQKRFHEITGARLIEGYGLSESSPITHSNTAFGENRLGSIGIPWPDTEARIVDGDIGERVLPPGEVGELCVRGPQVMRGYWNQPAETAQVLRPDPAGGRPWLHTGDLAMMDADGFFQIVDRKKDMILGAGGYNIYPREIEEVLYAHPKVREAAALGMPVPERGEEVVAVVALKEGESATPEEIIAYCRQNLAPYKVPKRVLFRADLPKTLVGKVLRRKLREEAAAAETPR